MGNLIDYLHWKGGVRFQNAPFCDMDSMVFSLLSYIDFSKVLSIQDQVTLETAIKTLKEIEIPRFLALDYPFKKELYAKFLDAILASPRFKDLEIRRYVDIHDEGKIIQFSATSFLLDSGEIAIAYRGTDESLIGWKEDCMLSFMEAPAQKKALEYLKTTLSDYPKAYVMGHSKGSNLALYSCIKCSDEELQKIKGIYLLDGPGLCKDVFPEIQTHRIDKLVHAYEPEFDIVAKIFKVDFSHTTILKSDEQGLMCHGLLSWQIEDGEFVTVLKNDPEAIWINRSIDNLVGNLSTKERAETIDALFDALSKNGAKTLFELGKNPVKTLENVLVKTFHVTKRNKNATRRVGLSLLFGTSFEDLKKVHKISDFLFSNIFYGLVMIAFGVVFLITPQSALPITSVVILSILVALEFAWALYGLIKSHWNVKEMKLRLLLLLFSLALYGALWMKEESISFFSSWLFGSFFILFGVWMSNSLDASKRKSLFDYIWNIAEIFLYITIGIYLLYMPDQFLSIGTFATGCILVIDGAIKIIR